MLLSKRPTKFQRLLQARRENPVSSDHCTIIRTTNELFSITTYLKHFGSNRVRPEVQTSGTLALRKHRLRIGHQIFDPGKIPLLPSLCKFLELIHLAPDLLFNQYQSQDQLCYLSEMPHC